MHPDPNNVVSGATETTADEAVTSSSDDTQTSDQETPEPPKPVERIDWKAKAREDADLAAWHNAEVQRQIKRALERRDRQQLKQTAKQAVDAEDGETGLAIARHIANSPDELDEEESRLADWNRDADRVQPQLERLLKLDAKGNPTSDYYLRVYQETGKPEMDRRYNEDPVGFVDWLDDQIIGLRVRDQVQKEAPIIAKGIATDEAHKALKGAAVPLTGGAGGGGIPSLDTYNTMSFEERMKLKRENPTIVDQMVARAAR